MLGHAAIVHTVNPEIATLWNLPHTQAYPVLDILSEGLRRCEPGRSQRQNSQEVSLLQAFAEYALWNTERLAKVWG